MVSSAKNCRYAGCSKKVPPFMKLVFYSLCLILCFVVACRPLPEIYLFNESDYEIQVLTKHKRVKIQPHGVEHFTFHPDDSYLKIRKDSGKEELYQVPPRIPSSYGRFKVHINVAIFGFVFKSDKIYIRKNELNGFSEETQPDNFPLVPLKKEAE